MRFETSVDIDADPAHVWAVLTDVEAWPRHMDTVERVDLLTPPPLADGSRLRMKQPKLPEGTWEVAAWDPPRSFELRQRTRGMTTVAGHHVEPTGANQARLTLTLDMRGLLLPFVALSKGTTNRLLAEEARGMKQACE